MFIVLVAWPDLSTGTRPGTIPKPPGLKLLASKNDTRAWPGGFGYAKVGANYGPALVSHSMCLAMCYDPKRASSPNLQYLCSCGTLRLTCFVVEGRKRGYDQILWLLGPEFKVRLRSPASNR
jgi:branched-chain amino acid aminotransferase